tara:strand:- start:759 stop:1178 length:420 start_codon:yes stop_codon:yes gene_type:complete
MSTTTTLKEQVFNHTLELCDILYEKIKEDQIKWHHRSIISSSGNDELYHIRQIREINLSGVDHEFYIKKGRKFLKVIHNNGDGSQSVHCFVDANTGDVHKAASWTKPQPNGIRYNLLDDKSRKLCFERADWAGGYLYVR